MDLIRLAVPFFLLAIGIELLWGWWKGRNTYRLNDSFSSLMLGILSQAQKFLRLGVGGLVYGWIGARIDHDFWREDLLLTWIAAFALYDLCYYWLHRLSHERQILWAAHVAHHQSEEYNLSTALRQTSTGFLLGWIFYIPMFLVGIPPEVMVTVGALNLIYQFWVHTRHIPELGWLEFVFVTPSNHRVHHAQNDQYVDRNYGGVFILWDRLFGTYQRELPDEPCLYGIRGPLKSWNPWHALTHIYRNMLNDMRRAATWIERWQVVVARTGWQPASIPAADRRQKNDLSHFKVYDPMVSAGWRFYGALQIVGATLMLLWAQLENPELVEAWLIFLLLLWTGAAAAFWLEGKVGTTIMLFDALRLCALAGFTVVSVADPLWLTLLTLWWVSSAFTLAVLLISQRAPDSGAAS
ncbi:MAG: sterol desaturase family protein [Luminiphilus sp.]